MSAMFALTPPVPPEMRLLIAAVGFGLTVLLARRVRGRAPLSLWMAGLAGLLVLVLGLETAGLREREGGLAFLLGVVCAVLVSLLSPIADVPHPSATHLAVACVGVGLALGFGFFVLWKWQARPDELENTAGSLVTLLTFGCVSGVITAGAVLLLNHGNTLESEGRQASPDAKPGGIGSHE